MKRKNPSCKKSIEEMSRDKTSSKNGGAMKNPRGDGLFTHNSVLEGRFIRTQELQTAVYSSSIAPIGAKLCQNAFQTIPGI